MRRAIVIGAVLLVGSALGATVLREPIANAASNVPAMFVSNDSQHPVPVREQNVDGSGNVKVHEQGTANVAGTVGLDTANNTVKIDSANNAVTPLSANDYFSSALQITGSFGKALDHTIYVSSVTISAFGNTVDFTLLTPSSYQVTLRVPAGQIATQTYPNPVPVNYYQLECIPTTSTCTAVYSVVGRHG